MILVIYKCIKTCTIRCECKQIFFWIVWLSVVDVYALCMRQCSGSIGEKNTKRDWIGCMQLNNICQIINCKWIFRMAVESMACLLCVFWVKMFFNDHNYTIVMHIVRAMYVISIDTNYTKAIQKELHDRAHG